MKYLLSTENMDLGLQPAFQRRPRPGLPQPTGRGVCTYRAPRPRQNMTAISTCPSPPAHPSALSTRTIWPGSRVALLPRPASSSTPAPPAPYSSIACSTPPARRQHRQARATPASGPSRAARRQPAARRRHPTVRRPARARR